MNAFPRARTILTTCMLCLAPTALAAQEGAAPEPEATIPTAHQAFMRHDLDATRAILERALTGEFDPTDRAEAHRRLAALAWRFDGDFARGRDHLDRALEVAASRSDTHAERARLETATGRPEIARRAALDALGAARNAADSTRAVVRLAEAALARTPAGAWPDEESRRRLGEALTHLAPRVEPGLLEPARLQIPIALHLDDGRAALAAWRAYYTDALDREGPLPVARRTLEAVLPGWAGPSAPAGERRDALLALASSGFHAAARILAIDPRAAPARSVVGEPDVAEAVAYADFLDRVRDVTDDYYQRLALGETDSDAWVAGLTEALAALWPQLAREGQPPAFDDDAAVGEIERRFGAEFNLGTTAGYLDLHFGHRVIDDRRRVEQYGHSADLRFVALDGIVSNGFQSWAWDGHAAHGGWATAEAIVQIRPGYVGQGLRAWSTLAEPVSASRRDASRAEDLQRARRDPCAHLPDLRDRMHRQGMAWLRDSLASEGLAGEALRSAFLRAYDHARVESSIFAHEGRHAIDAALLAEDVGTEEREFRAKLSEVVFAPVPRLALRAINSPDAGDPTPHGRANQRILCGLAEWIEAHAEEIEGYDSALPALPQLDRLDDARLRDAFRSMDPTAETTPEPPT